MSEQHTDVKPHRYICLPCLHKHPDLEVYTLNYYLAATCCICGAVGTFRRLTSASAEKAAEAK